MGDPYPAVEPSEKCPQVNAPTILNIKLPTRYIFIGLDLQKYWTVQLVSSQISHPNIIPHIYINMVPLKSVVFGLDLHGSLMTIATLLRSPLGLGQSA